MHALKVSSVKPIGMTVASRGFSGLSTTQVFWVRKSSSMVGKNLSLPAQRASDEAAPASGSSGYSRKMNRTLPVSMSRCLSSGKTSLANRAQCGQVIEAYSMITFGALGAERLFAERPRLHEVGRRRIGARCHEAAADHDEEHGSRSGGKNS